jgi:hypothetical protein
MAALIARTRLLIGDPAGGSQQFADQDIQDTLDDCREDVKYELLTAAPDIVNAASTNNIPQIIWADYYSRYQWWETDLILQGYITGQGAWIVLTPLASDYIVGHWQFELTPFTNGTIPGQYPPVYLSLGKTYDLYLASSKLLELWAASIITTTYDFTQDGFNARRSQIVDGKLKLSNLYKCRARPRTMTVRRNDHPTPSHGERIPLLGESDVFRGEY